MAKLSQTEKYTIQGMLHDNKSIEEIAELTKRSIKCVENYVNGELDKLHSTIAKVQTEQLPIENPTEIVKPEVVKPKGPPRGQGKRTMVHQTFAGKGGVSIMTSASSAVGDDFLKAMKKTVSRTARGHIYDSEGNKIEE